MNLTKAIESLEADLLRPGSVDKLTFQDAEQLGIEALNFIQRNRGYGAGHVPQLLPGETED